MSYSHSNVYIVRVVDADEDLEPRTWFVGPYGSSRADHVAHHLEAAARDAEEPLIRNC